MRVSKSFLVHVLLILVAALMLVWTPLLNGYPFIHADSGAYVWSSVIFLVPNDRPIGYGLLIRAMSLAPSLWIVVIVQALGTAYLLMRVAEVFLKKHASRALDKFSFPFSTPVGLAFALVVLTILITTLSTFVGFILADIFASWLFLGTILFFLSPRRFDRVLAALAITAGVWTHNSHLPLALGLALWIAALLFFLPRARTEWLGPALHWFGVLAFAVLGMLGINLYLRAGLALSRGADTILLNRLAEMGVLQRTLEINCASQAWSMCSDLDTIRAHTGKVNWYLFGADSPVNEIGWEKGTTEQRAIVTSAFACCWQTILADNARETWKQFWLIHIQSYLVPLADNMNAVSAIQKNYPNEAAAFAASHQQNNIPTPTLVVPFDEATTQIISLILALVVSVFAAARKQWFIVLLIGSTMLFLVMNASITASVSGAFSRYQGRVYWLLPFVVLVAIASIVFKYRSKS